MGIQKKIGLLVLAALTVAGAALAAVWEVKGDQGKKYRYAMPDTVLYEFWLPAYTAEKEAVFFDPEDTRILDESDGMKYVMTTLLHYREGKASQQIQVFGIDTRTKKQYAVSTVDLPLYSDGKKGFAGKEWHGKREIPQNGNAYQAVVEKITKKAEANSKDPRFAVKVMETDSTNNKAKNKAYTGLVKEQKDREWTLLLDKKNGEKIYAKTDTVRFAAGEDPSQIDAVVLYQNRNGYTAKRQTYMESKLTGSERWAVVDREIAAYDAKGNLLSLTERELIPELPAFSAEGSETEAIGKRLASFAKPALPVADPLTEWNKKEAKKKAELKKQQEEKKKETAKAAKKDGRNTEKAKANTQEKKRTK